MRSVLLKSRGTDNKGQRTLAEFWVVVDTIISWVVLLYFSASSTRAATNIVQATLRLLSFRYFFACLPKRVRDRRRSNQERAPDAYRSACVGPLNANGVGCSSTLWRWFCAYVSSRDWASESRLVTSAIVGQCSLLRRKECAIMGWTTVLLSTEKKHLPESGVVFKASRYVLVTSGGTDHKGQRMLAERRG